MNVHKITSARGGLSDWEDKGTPGSFKFGANLDIRKIVDSISCTQALMDIGVTEDSASASISPSASVSPSASSSPSPSPSRSPSASISPSPNSPSASVSPSASKSPSASSSPSASTSPSSSVSPSPSESPGLRLFKDLIQWFVKASDGFIYGFGNTGRVYRINPDDFYAKQVYDVGSPILGAEEKPASGTTYLVFATNTEIHIKELPGDSNWNDVNSLNGWPKTNLTSADYHTMKQVAGDVLIANGSNVALIGYDNSYTNEAVNLIPGNIVKTIVERSGRGVFGTYRAGEPNNGINGAIDAEVPLSQVGSDGNIYFADMVNSMPVKRFPGGGKVNPGGVTNLVDQVNFFDWEFTALSWIDKQSVGNMAVFAVYSAESGKGGLYTMGRKYKNHPFTMNLEHQLDADELGACVAHNNLLYVSYRDGSDFGVKVTDVNNKATGIYEAYDFKSPLKGAEKITKYAFAEIFMKPLPAGCSVEFYYRMNKLDDFVQAKTADGETQYSTTNGKKAVFRIGEQGDIYEARAVLNPYGNTCPELYRIHTFFE